MSRLVWFCFGAVSGLGVSRNFKHKVFWTGNINDKTYHLSYPTGLKPPYSDKHDYDKAYHGSYHD